MGVDSLSRLLKHGCLMGPGRYGGLPSFLSFGVGGQSYSNFLASTVGVEVHC